MRVQIEPDELAVAARAADAICDVVRASPSTTLGLPTGATPVRTYAELERRVAAGDADLSRASAFAVDEFVAPVREAPGTNAAFFARHLRIRFHELRCPDAAATDPDAEIRAFAGAIRHLGGLDLCVLGIGVNGHIAFNEPGAAADSRARSVALTAESRAAHAEAFGSLDRVPSTGMTLGIADLLESRRILLIAQGYAKSAIVRVAVQGPESADVPASWLRRHADVTWLLDAAAAAQLCD